MRGFWKSSSGIVHAIFVLTCAGLLCPARVQAISGLEGTFEFGLDAPWRMEPSRAMDGSTEYGPIPIQVTIHDALHTRLDNIYYATDQASGAGVNLPVKLSLQLPDQMVSVGKFHSVRVTEIAPTQRQTIEFGINNLFEIEQVVGDWMWPSIPNQGPFHEICRVWKGDVTADYIDVSRTSEWHASLYYVPGNKAPGTTVTLKIEVVLERDQWPEIKLPLSHATLFNEASRTIILRNYVRVYLAPEKLPRFDKRWLYGDFHYHSQGTDNEGEAGYNYRGVVRAMGAMGMDFVFATDHASTSAQIIDADLPPIDKIPEIAHSQGDKLKEENARVTMNIARDMNFERYAWCHDLIYGTTGVNREASYHAGNLRWPQNYNSYGVVPQIFLGGELDAIPEIKRSTLDSANPPGATHLELPFGNGLRFDLSRLCSPESCDDVHSMLAPGGEPDTYLVQDFQSVGSFQYYGREHMVYFPNSSNLYVGNEMSFIPSYTSQFGGATRRLAKVNVSGENFSESLLPEVERKGVVFIAHHLNGGGARGPDGVPWTQDHMLLKAFKSPAVLGLEFWNEDTRYRTRVCSHDYCRPGSGNGVYLGEEYGYERHEKLEAHTGNPLLDALIAIFSLPGIDYDALPSEYHHIALPLEEVRAGFINGGVFELTTFDPQTGYWQESSGETEHQLYHGGYDWDLLNLRGLDFEHNTDLTWLKPGEPRRVFMGGGSDAHGDLNYRRAGYFLGTDDANNTAIGKPRNLVFVGEAKGFLIQHIDPPKAEIINSYSGSAAADASDPVTARIASSGQKERLKAQFALNSALGQPVIDAVKPPLVADPPFAIQPTQPGIFFPPGVFQPIDPPVVIIDPPPVVDPPVVDPPVVKPPVNIPPDAIDPPVVIVDPPPVVDPPVKPPVTRPPDAIDPPVVIVDPPPVVDPPVKPPVTRPPDAIDPPVVIVEPPIDSNPTTNKPPVFHPPIDDVANIGIDIRAHSQEQVIAALRRGRFCVTDGPALRIAIDKNDNGQIDDNDIQMGDIYNLPVDDRLPGLGNSANSVRLLVECVSTAEFGPIMRMDVYVGVHPGTAGNRAAVPVAPRMYAPLNHGVPYHVPSSTSQESYESGGITYLRMDDNYWQGDFLGDGLAWSYLSGSPLLYTNTFSTTLHLNKYQVGKGVAGERFFVRAFALTAGEANRQVPNSYAFTNPIWILPAASSVAPGGAVEGDGNPNGTGKPLASAHRDPQGRVMINFTGRLQFSPRIGEPFQDVDTTANPYVVPMNGTSGYFRSRQ